MKKTKISLTLDDGLLLEIDRIVFKRRQGEKDTLKQTSRSEVIEELVRKGMNKHE